MVAIIDYGVGNLFSLKCSLDKIGAESVVTGDADVIKNADRIILPGVGAFGDAVDKLRNSGLFEVVTSEAISGKPILGICLGMQLLFEKSSEYGEHTGLGLIKGEISPMSGIISKEYKIPHIGWNALQIKKESKLFKYIKDGDFVYYVHSFCGTGCADSVIATSEYGADITGSVESGNIYGCQFHPEKSGEVGLNILRAFCEL